MSEQPAAPGPAKRPVAPRARQIRAARLRSALMRYRVMAWITGSMLLLLCVEMVLKYVVQVNGVGEPVIGNWIAFAHGWIYVVYLVTVIDLWSQLRWGFGRLVAIVLAGVVPALSFVMEHRVVRDVRASGVLTSGVEQPTSLSA